MPVTRRQATKIDKRVVIPPKNDTSLVQKRGNCIEGLATALFQIIQKFLTEYDYCQLMNTNLSTFQPIKYETVRYTISGNRSDLCEAYNEMVALQLIDSVKDKSKQISVKLVNVDEKLIRKYAKFFNGATRVFLVHFTFGVNMKFQVFNSIAHLLLIGCDVRSVVDLNLENLEFLLIYRCNFEGISSWNGSGRLRSITITGCRSLEFLPPLDKIRSVEIKDCDELCDIQTTGGHETFAFRSEFLSPESLQYLIQPSFYEKVQVLELCCEFPSEFLGFSFCQNIPVVELTARHGIHHEFPVFYGEELRLQSFRLSAWNDCKELPKLEVCVLHSCKDFKTFPVSPELRTLSVEKCYDLTTVPSQPNLNKLVVHSCELLEKIDYCPNLVNAVFFDCDSLKDFTLCSSLEVLSFSLCEVLKTLHVVPVAADFDENSGIITNNGLQTKCRIRLGEWLPSMNDFAFCQNVYEVELASMEKLVNLQGLTNISCLKITDCPKLVSTEGIGKILKRIIFDNCPALTRLVGLQGIPEVLIRDCQKITDFTGLGNHDLLVLSANALFKKLLKEYRKNNQHGEIFSTTKEIRFGPVTK
jgi:hypothetical protein